ncbi:VWA domain-containing protein [Candidatus Entotheonella serta]|nr:VWA domain-containing protein [Candidatus Entotheonella serta]
MVKHSKSIMRSPVVFAVKKPVAVKLGWIDREVRVRDILDAAETGDVRFAMTSATQSNTGASAYLGYLHAFANNPDVVTKSHLQDVAVQEQIKRFLGNVHRQTGSSGWLMELLLEHYEQFDAMVNYEALVIEANQQLVKRGQAPLYVIYPIDGLTIADSPLAYVDRGNADLETAFLKLQSALLEDDVQRQILARGRRVGRVGLSMEAADSSVFNTDWGVDVKRVLSTINLPSGEVISEALNLFQTAFRKPSLTAYVLDFSGSMKGSGEQQVKAAMRTLLEPNIAAQYLLQASPRDISMMIVFNSAPSKPMTIKGNEPRQLRGLLKQIEARQPGGGTNMYEATKAALQSLQTYEAQMGQYHTAVIVMSDGKSDGSLQDIKSAKLWRDIPVYTILFGEADPDQMHRLADATLGCMFDGRTDMIRAFRQAKGYN